MPRLNLTLDDETFAGLIRHAQKIGQPRSGVARELISEALSRRKAEELRNKLVQDYSAGRDEVRTLLKETESAQMELLGDEEA